MQRADPSAEAAMFARRVGASLKAFRKTRGLTQAEAADLLGHRVAIETVSRFERGVNEPSFEWLARFAKIYGVTLDDLLLTALRTRRSDDKKRDELYARVEALEPERVSLALDVTKIVADAIKKAVDEI